MSKNIVICCDGTNSPFGGVNTNVAHLFERVGADDAHQYSRYEPGVGTFAADLFSVNIGRTLGKLLGAAFGYGLKQNLENAYRYVVECYDPGDRLFIFGFSRGAFTARAVRPSVAVRRISSAYGKRSVRWVFYYDCDDSSTTG